MAFTTTHDFNFGGNFGKCACGAKIEDVQDHRVSADCVLYPQVAGKSMTRDEYDKLAADILNAPFEPKHIPSRIHELDIPGEFMMVDKIYPDLVMKEPASVTDESLWPRLVINSQQYAELAKSQAQQVANPPYAGVTDPRWQSGTATEWIPAVTRIVPGGRQPVMGGSGGAKPGTDWKGISPGTCGHCNNGYLGGDICPVCNGSGRVALVPFDEAVWASDWKSEAEEWKAEADRLFQQLQEANMRIADLLIRQKKMSASGILAARAAELRKKSKGGDSFDVGGLERAKYAFAASQIEKLIEELKAL